MTGNAGRGLVPPAGGWRLEGGREGESEGGVGKVLMEREGDMTEDVGGVLIAIYMYMGKVERILIKYYMIV